MHVGNTVSLAVSSINWTQGLDINWLLLHCPLYFFFKPRCSIPYTCDCFFLLFSTAAQLMLREDTFTVAEGDPGYNTSVLIIVDVMDSQEDIELNYTVSSTATSMYSIKMHSTLGM